ncbi:MAG TPA: aldehyde dehydrogenase [Nevskiaceae bacterium]|nr:aldehyde dehydrogenase [Nevskiaceae bacterium]
MSGDPSIAIAHPERFYIGGEWVPAASPGRREVVSPSTERVVAVVAEAAEADAERAVAAARRAFDQGPWPRLTPAERATYLHGLAVELRARIPALRDAWTAQVGAPIAYSRAMTPAIIDGIDQVARLHERPIWVERQPTIHAGHTGLLVREPVGVVAAIVPWNGPLFTLATKLAPALLAGCTVVIKPAPETPLEAYLLCECAEAAGFPPGVINLVVADRAVSDFLVRQPAIDKVSFTGSTVAGKRIAEVCAQRMARTTLELGGKSAALILDDVDLDQVAGILAPTSCRLSGQVCSNLTRYLVPEAKHDALADALAARMRALKVGDPFADDTQMGPIAMRRQLDKVEHYVALGQQEGARLVTGGRRMPGFERGFFYEPTLLGRVDNGSRVARDEIFGPVIALIPYRDLDHAVALANDSDFGLNGAVFTRDTRLAYDVARRIRTGTVAQNGSKSDYSIGFGGFKQSGIGREGGLAGVLSYLEPKTVVLEGDFDAGH